MYEKTTQFGDVNRRKDEAQLKERLAKAIFRLSKLIKNPADKEKILKFREHLGQSKYRDESQLPYYNSNLPNSPIKKKITCLLSIIADVVLNWWSYQIKDISYEEMDIAISELEYIGEQGLEHFTVSGNMKNGWHLWE